MLIGYMNHEKYGEHWFVSFDDKHWYEVDSKPSQDEAEELKRQMNPKPKDGIATTKPMSIAKKLLTDIGMVIQK